MARDRTVRFAAFDLDGTLFDSAGSIVDGVRACWRACGFPPPDPEAVRRIIGLPWEESVRALLPGAGPAEFRRIRAYHDEIRIGARPRPERRETLFAGARRTLDALDADGWALGVVTSRSGARAFEMLEEHGIGGVFATVKTADMGPGKPDPHLLLEAMDDVGAAAEATAMIGDTTFDMEMAVAAGAAAHGVGWGVHETAALRAAGALHIAESFDDLRRGLAPMAAGGP